MIENLLQFNVNDIDCICEEDNCSFKGKLPEVLKHMEKEKHDPETSLGFADEKQVLTLYRKNIVITIMKKLQNEDVMGFFEEVECDRKDFNNIHPDMTDHILEKYGRKKLLNEMTSTVKAFLESKNVE